MEPIVLEFMQGNFHYRHLERYGNLAIYEQTHKHGSMVRYEVIRIRRQATHTWPDGTTTPEKEAYPGSGSWGKDGFTTYTLADARENLAQWLVRLAAGGADAPEEVPSV